MDRTAWPAYALRMALAATFVAAGLDHIGDGGMAWAVRWFPWPEPAGWALAYGELFIGLGLAAGALFPVAAGAAGFVAAGAMLTILVTDGVLMWQNLAMLGAAGCAIALGPGPAALDALVARRWPGLARWLEPFRGEAARDGALRALQVCLGGGLIAAFALSLARGDVTSATVARLHPLLGLAVFAARPVAGALVLLGAAPRAAGGLLSFVGVATIAALPLDYHAYVPLAVGLVLLRWPRFLEGGQGLDAGRGRLLGAWVRGRLAALGRARA